MYSASASRHAASVVSEIPFPAVVGRVLGVGSWCIGAGSSIVTGPLGGASQLMVA